MTAARVYDVRNRKTGAPGTSPPVYLVGERAPGGKIRLLWLNLDQWGRLIEGTCPLAHLPEFDPRLTVTEDGWARCRIGFEWRFPAPLDENLGPPSSEYLNEHALSRP